VTNARFAALHGQPVVPYAFSTTPGSTSQIRALVTSGNGLAASAAGFRLRLGGGGALANRRPKP